MDALLIPLNVLIPLSLVVIILIVVLWYIYSKNKKIYETLVSEKRRFSIYKQNIYYLKNAPQSPKADFDKLNQIARGFFKEYLDFGGNLTYLELSEIFRKEEKKDYVKFCDLMSEINYSGKKEKEGEKISQAIDLFYNIINSY